MQTAEARKQLREERKHCLGGSDAPVILGLRVPGKRTKYQIWARLTGRVEESDADNPILRRGRLLEYATRSEYQHENPGRKIEEVHKLLVHPDHPWMGVHLDGLIHDDDRPNPGVFEGKAPSPMKMSEWDEESPDYAQVQLMHGMVVAKAILGCDWGSVAGLIGGVIDFKWQDLDWNQKFVDFLMREELAFMELVQERNTPPPVEADDFQFLDQVYDVVEGKVIDLDSEAQQWAIDEQRWALEIKRLTADRKEAKTKLKEAMGDATRGRLPGGGGYTLKQITPKPYTAHPKPYKRLLHYEGRA